MRVRAAATSVKPCQPRSTPAHLSCVLLCTPELSAPSACAVFSEYGEIVEVVILRDRRSGMHQVCTAAAQTIMPDTCRRRLQHQPRSPGGVRGHASHACAVHRHECSAIHLTMLRRVAAL